MHYNQWKLNQVMDYYNALGEALTFGTPYIIILEDDIEVCDDFGRRALQV